ncbi:hypothetical protein [Mesorhizobium sp. M1E.F.Ca.ET.063.01.1.1]|uniref:hypothetical protein n=1 Tax=Mesorhizobium sp. M1E.F.Ca.ET.063.01.1.1 TaxID=2496750 RepID=UPI000FCC654C|nr:hypothetical protein [Mesorhizobium sp. M1E.F.Ca.ET.063.01.1.1]RUW84118.1 hypothetical protein EOA29_10565 [Mesorhizobium sp. M1E.F.Ca.ET.063.01.1.1]
MIDDDPAPTDNAQMAEGGPQEPIEPYRCRYCGWMTTVSNEAAARLCMRCVRFEGDVHPAVTGARIAAHNALILGMVKKRG